MTVPSLRPELDRRIRTDTRNHPIRPAVHGIERKTTLWKTARLPLNQLTSGGSVAFGWVGMLEQVDPVRFPATGDKAIELTEMFREVERIDAQKAEPRIKHPLLVGSSVLAGARYCKHKGWITGYKWCTDSIDVVDTLCAYGPVLLGVQWFESMYDPDERGIVKVNGPAVGGHCIIATGYIRSDEAVKMGLGPSELIRFVNSFGKGYGIGGTGYLRVMDLAFLMKEGGEAVVPNNMSPQMELSRLQMWWQKRWVRRLTSAFRTD